MIYRNIRDRVFSFILGIAVLSGCTLQTRKSEAPVRAGDRAGQQRVEIPAPPPIVTSQPAPGDQGAAALPPAPIPPVADTFLSKELPKVGLILGPGGMKTYAHIGVLREFARARIPVHAVAGLEWGAMMAAFYAEKGQANDVDWKAFRLKESDVPGAGMLRGYRAKSIGDFDSYLSTAFSGASAGLSADHAKVPFGCPSVVKRDKFQFLSKGAMKELMLRCVPFPPLVGDSENIAAASAVEESAQWLRSQGANLIVLVNVLGGGETLTSKLAEEQYGTSVLWTEVRRDILKVRAPTVNWVVSVNTAGQKIDDFGGRRAAVEAGAKAATDLTQKLSKQYGF